MANSANQTVGDYHQAQGWVDTSQLPTSTKESLLRFLRKFPTLSYYKLDRAGTQQEPEWLRIVSETLCGFMPNTLVWVQFDRFGHPSSRELALRDIWYHRMFTTEASSEYKRILLGQHQLLVMYSWLETLGSMLAVKIGDVDDHNVYEFDYGDIAMSTESDGVIPQESVSIVFKSYTELLDHIVAIRLEGGEIVRAKE